MGKDKEKPQAIKNKEFVGKLSVRSKGNFDLKEFYSLTHQFFSDRQYFNPADGTPYIEESYFQEDSQNGKNIQYKWVGKKPKPEQGLWTPQISLKAEINDLVDVEKVVNNKKVKSNFADVKVTLEANIFEVVDKDVHEKIKGWWDGFKGGYIQSEYDNVEDDTFSDLMDLHGLIKKLLSISA